MTRILHIANFNSLRLKGCFQCGFPVKITSGLIKNGFEVINYADRDLCRMFGFGHMNALGRWRLNKHLLEFCRTTRPDAILLGHANTVENETILKIRKTLPGIKVMQWNCDAVTPESKRNVNALNERLEVVDLTMISTGDKKMLNMFKKDDKPVAYLPNMADAAIETGTAFAERILPFDVLLCTNTGRRQFCGKDKETEEILSESENRIAGIRWLLGGLRGRPPLHGADYLDAFKKAGIGFNFSRYNDVYLYSSDRLAHIIGNGELALIDRATGFADIIPEDGAAFYGSEEEFYDKLAFYKNNADARMKAARKGYEAFYREFDNKTVTAYMAALLSGTFKTPERPWQIVI